MIDKLRIIYKKLSNRGRIVQFQDDSFGYQRLLFGFIPVTQFLDLDNDDRYDWVRYPPRGYCKEASLSNLKSLIKRVEKSTEGDKIKQVVKDSGLDKVLD